MSGVVPVRLMRSRCLETILREVDCPFCRYPRNDAWLTRTGEASLLVDAQPMLVGHLLMVPHDHVPSIDDVEQSQQRLLAETTQSWASRLSAALSSPVSVVEHGRSPICLGHTNDCHVHEHLIPFELSGDLLSEIDFLVEVNGPHMGEYLAVRSSHNAETRYFRPTRSVRHLVRTVCAFAATEQGLAWMPLFAGRGAWAPLVAETTTNLAGLFRVAA